MKNIYKSVLVLTVIVGLSFVYVATAQAMTPSLSISSVNNNDVQIIVNGDSNAQVTLYYTNPGSNQNSINSLGYTNSNGYFSTTISSGYNIYQNAIVYVSVNGQQSQSVTWPHYNGNNCDYYNCNNNGSLWLSQSSVYLSNGQTVSVTVNGGNNNYYISSNSNSNIATANVSGNTISIYGNNSGSTTFSICSNGGNGCVTLYVNVDGNGYYNNSYNETISFSQDTVNVAIGQTQLVAVYGSGNYHLSNNSNSSVADVEMRGGNVAIYGRMAGTATLTVCSLSRNYNWYNYNNNSNNCSTLNVTVGGAYYPGYVYPTYPTVISLAQVPYTGIGSNLKIASFVSIMALWTAGLAYFLVRRKHALT